MTIAANPLARRFLCIYIAHACYGLYPGGHPNVAIPRQPPSSRVFSACMNLQAWHAYPVGHLDVAIPSDVWGCIGMSLPKIGRTPACNAPNERLNTMKFEMLSSYFGEDLTT